MHCWNRRENRVHWGVVGTGNDVTPHVHDMIHHRFSAGARRYIASQSHQTGHLHVPSTQQKAALRKSHAVKCEDRYRVSQAGQATKAAEPRNSASPPRPEQGGGSALRIFMDENRPRRNNSRDIRGLTPSRSAHFGASALASDWARASLASTSLL